MRKPVVHGDEIKESPEYVRLSLGAAMTLKLRGGEFYRNAKLYCINLLMTYEQGCRANCAYCGLQKTREGKYSRKSFIRVEWPVFSVKEIVERIKQNSDSVKRICLSQITHSKVPEHTKEILQMIRPLNKQISILICPTVTKKSDLEYYKELGVNMLGVAFDLATPELFVRYRGDGVKGPHKWQKYENTLYEARTIFGKNRVGVHLIVGLGETEKQMAHLIQTLHDKGILSHLFSFYPEENSLLKDYPQPAVSQYRRMQLARYLITKGKTRFETMGFNKEGQITAYGVPDSLKQEAILCGKPFLTSGCPHCTRTYGDCAPGDDIRSFPFPLSQEDIAVVQTQLDECIK